MLLGENTREAAICSELYVVHVSRDYNGNPLPMTRITRTKPQDCPTGHPEWSPDGEYISFMGSEPPKQIHKVKSDGSERAVKLTNFEAPQGYWLTGWRD